MDVFTYFLEVLKKSPGDFTLKEVSLDSVVGVGCKKVIDAAATLIAVSDISVRESIIDVAFEAVEVYWRG